jgi:hypothetical protein
MASIGFAATTVQVSAPTALANRVLCRGTMKRICLILLLVALCSRESLTPAEKTQYWSTNGADEVACQGKLNIIYGVLQEYQRRNQNLPRWLSDLVPEYLDDPNSLVCPFVLSTGNLKRWREKYHLGGVFDDPGSCSYAYEFRTEVGKRSDIGTRAYKQRQMELIGLGVPMVRCLAHQPGLNLGFDGSLYQNPTSAKGEGEWEDVFAISPKHREVFHKPIPVNISETELVLKLIQPRKRETEARMLDLSAQYNALLFHLSQVDPSGKLRITYPEGVQNFGGVDFDIRGLVHLTARQFPIPFPERMSIPVKRKCVAMHFLHGATSATRKGAKIATCIVRLDQRRRAEVPIIYGKDVKERWFDPDDKSELASPDQEARPAWITPLNNVGPTGKSLRLYVSSWKNEFPESEVTSIDFVSYMTESAPFILAITIE